jgi:hypothetical protein
MSDEFTRERLMKRVIIFSMVVAALVMAFSGVALAAKTTPQDIYNDYADNGKLDGKYTKAELTAYLNDATTHAYGHESTLGELDALVKSKLTENRSTFPFTGMEMGLLAVGALVLIGAGVVLRKASR